MKNWLARIKAAAGGVRDFLDERKVPAQPHEELSKFQKFAHFWLMVARSFSRNRCPARASALAYTTLLAMIPMLVVAIGVSTSILKKQGEQHIYDLIDKFVASVTPPALMSTNVISAPHGRGPEITTNSSPSEPPSAPATITNEIAAGPLSVTETNSAGSGEHSSARYVAARKQAAEMIRTFIENTRSTKLGVVGSVLLIFVAISMLSRVEETFNDIWGVARGRSWYARIVQYWAVISLGPLLLTVALGLASGPHFQTTKHMLSAMPVVSELLFLVLPVVLLCLSFAVFYMLMPNTKVRWNAALVGGLVGGILWHLNTLFSVLYVSRVVSYSRVYGTLGLVPVFMVGLYFSWVILLFGAQVAYAYQNRIVYFQERIIEQVNQRGREFIALRIMEAVGRRFHKGAGPASVTELACQLAVPTRLVQQILQTLTATRLVVEAAGPEITYAPARPLDNITCHDILLALRAGQGQQLATSDEPARIGVYGEFEKILAAERAAASAVTVQAMVNRTDCQLMPADQKQIAAPNKNPVN